MDEGNDTITTTPRVPLGGDYWTAEPAAPLWGFADLHAHLMAHLAFGGNAFWGLPYDPEHPGEEGMQHALSSCAPIHGGLININPEFGHVAGGGWPDFIIWPRFTTMVHQQAYIDWFYRAYQGGLRLVTCLAVNNELLAAKSNPRFPHDDKSEIEIQIAAMKEMAQYIDMQAGGEGLGWLQIAYTPDEASKIIKSNKLAIILGVEVDSLGNWRSLDDLEKASNHDPEQARQLIDKELDWLYGLGVRQVTPIHLTNNAFGGTAIYMRFLEMVNVFLTGKGWTVENAWDTGVRYRLDQDGDNLVDDVERTVAASGGRPRAMHRSTLIDHIPGINTLVEAIAPTKLHGGHANALGLTAYGIILLEEMMKRGFIIDIDHMSEKATDSALTLAEQHNYPVICSHTWFRDLLFSGHSEFDPINNERYGTSDVHKVAHEAGKRGDQIERISQLGGVIAPILNQGDLAGLRHAMPELAGKIPDPCAGSSTSWAQAYLYVTTKMNGRGVALGSDINGAACLPGPRFGTSAAYGAHPDHLRTSQRRAEIDNQTNGVAYSTPIRDYRWHRFESSGAGAYDENERDIWQAIAQYEAGFNPSVQPHSQSDFPELSLKELFDAAHLFFDHDWIDHVTTGFFLADQPEMPTPNEIEDWPKEQQAAFYACKGIPDDLSSHNNESMQELVHKIKAIKRQWHLMKGNNQPLLRSTAGERRDFDINLDGMAHYGMLPDMLQDICNTGLTPQDLAPLFRSAYDYVVMWNKCVSNATH
jgi:microsomal dipeptidase-like Zn-dependent dipeptidase